MLNVLCSLEPVMSLKLISHGKSFYDSQKTKYVSIIYRCLMVEIADKSIHCKDLHLQYISTTTPEMYAPSASGVRLQDVVHYISSTSISRSADVL